MPRINNRDALALYARRPAASEPEAALIMEVFFTKGSLTAGATTTGWLVRIGREEVSGFVLSG